MSVQSWLNSVWYDRAAPPWWLVPLSLVYGAVSGMRRFLYVHHLRRATRISCPIVVVGNLSVGGTGKTPLVCWLVAHLAERGYRPGVVTRGYGGSSGNVRRISALDDPTVVGDESILLARRTGAPVAIGRDRPAAAQLLVSAGCNVIVSDDGLQHYALARDCEIVVIDGDRRFGNGWLLPAGPLREAPGRLKVADAIVVNGGRALLPGALSMRLEAKNAVALRGGAVQPLRAFAGKSIHAIAGIGNPERFFNMLRSRGIEVFGRPLADHAHLTHDDIAFGDDKLVLMTEKDAVKCAAFAGEQHWYVPVAACFEGGESNSLLDIVTSRIENATTSRKDR
ncbi:MAG TPA: tetraacyldisaccharide 4'-kinase [Steroidobacteraceae bacterium]|jgi:tetraacyldisaccharide 4'-kinase|nr:tetraacyldisaccharide 4'-kinase [Steroidobacteraceae bacterium]